MKYLFSLLARYVARHPGPGSRRTNRRRTTGTRKTPCASLGVERLEGRELPSVMISIGDASASEGPDVSRIVDVPINSGSSPVDTPKSMVQGPNGDYFVISNTTNSVLRYDGATFQYLGAFVSPGSGGLLYPTDLVFANGDLFVTSANTDAVLRYNGQTGSFIGAFVASGTNGINRPTNLLVHNGQLFVGAWQDTAPGEVHRYDLATGAFIDKFVAPGAGGLDDPVGMAFGPDGNFYVAEFAPVETGGNNAILRYDGTTGAFIDEFVPEGSGGLIRPAGIQFGPDGNLYVVNLDGDSVLRYHGASGAFLDVFVPAGLGGIDQPTRSLFTKNQMLLCSQNTDQVVRYEVPSWAVFNVTLSAASASPVAVSYATVNGTAIAGSDFVYTAGTVTFAPGETAKTILVRTLADTEAEPTETFTVDLSNADGATIADGEGMATILDQTKFYVVNDDASNRTYEYGTTGLATENYTLGSGNTAPRGTASNAAGDRLWVLDANKNVYVYSPSGGLFGSWTAGSLNLSAQVEGITTNGTDVWLLDNKQDKVFKYTGAASRLSGSQNAASSFNLNSGNSNGKGMVTDGTSLWVVNDGSPDKVFKYTLTGTLLGSWTIDAANASPTGLTINPANVSDIWVVDNGTDKVYQYTAAASRTSGSQNAAATFALAAGNTNPQDIADPPPATLLAAPTSDTQVVPFQVTGGGNAPRGLPVFAGGTAPHNATGTATHLGKYTGEGLFTLLGFTSATTGTFRGSFVFVAANGDRLAFNYGAATLGTFTVRPARDGKVVVQFVAVFTPVSQESTGRFANVTGGRFTMIATTEPFVLQPDALGYTAPFDYTWVGEGWLEFGKGKGLRPGAR
jgi:hypothetical protein